MSDDKTEKERALEKAIEVATQSPSATIPKAEDGKENDKSKNQASTGITDGPTLNLKGSAPIDAKDSIRSLNAPKTPNMNRQLSASQENYLSRLDTIKSEVRINQQRLKYEKKKELLFGPAVVWYLAVRYKCTEEFSWWEWYVSLFAIPCQFATLTFFFCLFVLVWVWF